MKKKMIRNVTVAVLCALTVFSLLPASAMNAKAASSPPPAYVSMQVGLAKAINNGKETTVDKVGTKPFKISGKTMLPLRFLGEKLGGNVKYVSDSKPIVMTYGSKKVEILINSKKMTVFNGTKKTSTITLDVPVQKKNGKTYIPLRAIGQALGFQVYYESGTECIVVSNPKMSSAVLTQRLNEAKTYFKDKKTVLRGKIVCLDPGHGTFTKAQAKTAEPIAPGSTKMKRSFGGGTTGVATKTPEHKYVLDFAFRMKAELEKEGAVVIMTRTGEKSITSVTRAKIANNAEAEATIRIHCDGSENRSARGASAYVASDKYVKNAALRKESSRLAQYLVDAHCAKTGLKNKGVIPYSDFTGLNWSTVPSTLFELGYMSNPDEDKLMATEEFKKNSIAGLIQGLKGYFSE